MEQETNNSELLAQVAAEAKAIDTAPFISAAGHVGRCSFCGRVANHLEPAHDYLPDVGGTMRLVVERYRGECCNAK